MHSRRAHSLEMTARRERSRYGVPPAARAPRASLLASATRHSLAAQRARRRDKAVQGASTELDTVVANTRAPCGQGELSGGWRTGTIRHLQREPVRPARSWAARRVIQACLSSRGMNATHALVPLLGHRGRLPCSRPASASQRLMPTRSAEHATGRRQLVCFANDYTRVRARTGQSRCNFRVRTGLAARSGTQRGRRTLVGCAPSS